MWPQLDRRVVTFFNEPPAVEDNVARA